MTFYRKKGNTAAAESMQNVSVVDPTTGIPASPAATRAPVAPATATATSADLIAVQCATTKPTLTNGQQGAVTCDTRGNLPVTIYGADTASALALGPDNADALVPSSTATRMAATARLFVFNGTNWDRKKKANAASRIPSAANTNNATVAKATPGEVHAINGYNASASVRYLKFYNKATAPAPASDTPVLTFALPPTATFHFHFPEGFFFSTGIAYALVTGAGDTDDTAVTAADILGLNIAYS